MGTYSWWRGVKRVAVGLIVRRVCGQVREKESCHAGGAPMLSAQSLGGECDLTSGVPGAWPKLAALAGAQVHVGQNIPPNTPASASPHFFLLDTLAPWPTFPPSPSCSRPA